MAVFLSAFLPLTIVGLIATPKDLLPALMLNLYGTVPALVTVCLTFLPFHIYVARRGRPPMRQYALWGSLVGGGFIASFIAFILSLSDEVSVLTGLILSSLIVGACGGVIFHFFAFIGIPKPLPNEEKQS